MNRLPRYSLRLGALSTVLALGLAACSSTDSADSAGPANSTATDTPSAGSTAAAGEQAAFPVTISHALGETTIEQAPERIATVGWANEEVPLALGIVPVGMPKVTWGDEDGDGMQEWVKEKLEELGTQPSDMPVLFDETDAIPFEQIANTNPDLILASYSGISEEEYEQLSKIAPVVAYPGIPWGTSVEEMVTMGGQALGLNEEAATLNAELKTEVSDALALYPQLKESAVLFTSFGGQNDNSTVGFYVIADPRAGFLAEAGIGVPAVVEEESKDATQFWVERSAEDVEAFEDIDLIISYGSDDAAENEATLARLQADPLLGRIPAIRAGHVVFLGTGSISAAANPSPLSIPWGIKDYFGLLASGLSADGTN